MDVEACRMRPADVYQYVSSDEDDQYRAQDFAVKAVNSATSLHFFIFPPSVPLISSTLLYISSHRASLHLTRGLGVQ